MRNHWIALSCAITLSCVGCTGGESDEFAGTADPELEEMTNEALQALSTATFSGIVRNEQGNPVAGAIVKINGVASTTDAAGKYFRSILASTNGYQIAITMAGFVPAQEVFLTGRLGAIHELRAAEMKQINPTQTNTVTSSKGAQVTIPANSLVDVNGVVVTGPVNIAIATIDPKDMPGDFTATNAAGQTVAIESIGTMHVGATLASSGAELQLKAGTSAIASLPVPAAIGGTMPSCVAGGTCKLALWRFDPTGKWIEKAANRTFTSTKTTFTMSRGGGGIADNGGLGTWNADIEKQAPACTIVQFVGIPQECYRPPSTPPTAPDPGITLTTELPYSSGPLVKSESEHVPSSLPFVALYNISANALQNVGVKFPAGAPAYCAANLEIFSDMAPAAAYPNYTPSGGTTRFNSGAPWGGVGKPLAQGTANVITLADVTADPPKDPCKSHVLFTTNSSPAPVMKNAMTWSVLTTAQANSTNVYALPGSDSKTNPYQGDTWSKNELPLLCINKPSPLLPSPGTAVIGNPVQTPGGAWRRTWSGGTIAATAPVKGTTLTSLAVANALCASSFGAGYRMAEFHDGAPNLWSGWDFWGKVLGANLGPFSGQRFWVSINDQNANTW